MTKKDTQKTLWLPPEFAKEMSAFYQKFKVNLEVMGIKSEAELIRVLARIGKDRLTQVLQVVRVLREADQTKTREILESLGITDKK